MNSLRLAHRLLIGSLILVAPLLWCSRAAAKAHSGLTEAEIAIYTDSLAEGFYNWSWTSTNLQSVEQVRQGKYAVYGRLNRFEGVYFGRNDALNLPLQGTLVFSIYSISPAEIAVQLSTAAGAGEDRVLIDVPAGRWKEVAISLSELGGADGFTGVWWQQVNDNDKNGLYLDDIRIIGVARTTPEPPVRLSVTTEPRTIVRQIVDPASGVSYTTEVLFPKRISEDIYGINFAPNTLREELGIPVSRWGGNAVERYNYQTSSSNQGQDWFFANNPMAPGADSTFESENQLDGTDTIMTVPLIGWVSSGRQGSCSYPINLEEFQERSIHHWVDQTLVCGNGYRAGEFIGPVDPARTSIAVDEDFVAGWVSTLVSQHGSASSGGVEYYALGNEPGLWHSTHGDLQSRAMSRDDIIERNIRYARTIKSVDPAAEILGPVLWGASSYYVSSDELLAGQRPGHVDYFLRDYLTRMKRAEQTHSRRLLDRLAVNFYDERVYDGGTDELRLESTRHLWDSTYAPSDWWVTRDFLYGHGSALIPRLRSAVDEFYPGTKLALTEYHFGGADTGVGGLAQIDALGIFGREGLDMATLWEPYADYVTTPEVEFANKPVFRAFRMYRNFNGEGGRFGTVSLFAESSDESRVSIYAARHGTYGAITLMVVNKTDSVIPLALEGLSSPASGFRFLADEPDKISKLGRVAVDGSDVLPRYSATLLLFSD